MDVPQFLRLFPLRTPNIMWFLGAGASVAAGVPTATDMVWDFKRRIYCAETRTPIALCPPSNDEGFRLRLDSYFAAKSTFPPNGSEEEYSHYFEFSYPDERERQRYIDECVSRARLSQGYIALAALVKLGRITAIWTTNFDRLVEDAVAKASGGTGHLHVVTLDSAAQAAHALGENRRPVLLKLHGDFLSRKLKNTAAELEKQDQELRRCLTLESGRRGLAVVGYSGRDDSIMSALEGVVAKDGKHAFPGGLFWFYRSKPFDRVSRFIERAQSLGVDASLVEIQSFEEFITDLFTLIEDVPEEVKRVLEQDKPRLIPAEIPAPGSNWPVIRMNAIPVTGYPNVCRRISCSIGGSKEVRTAIENSGAKIVATRRDVGVICFGSDAEVRRTFGQFEIKEFDLFPIEASRMMFETAELGLLNEAIARAIARERPLIASWTRQGWKLHPDPERLGDERLKFLFQIEGGMSGTIPNTEITWFDAALIKLTSKLDRLWLLFEPAVWIQDPMTDQVKSLGETDNQDDDQNEDCPAQSADGLVTTAIREFKRERAAKRYNRQLLTWMDSWVSLLVGTDTGANSEVTLRCLGIGDGIDASFTLCRTTAFSRRL